MTKIKYIFFALFSLFIFSTKAYASDEVKVQSWDFLYGSQAISETNPFVFGPWYSFRFNIKVDNKNNVLKPNESTVIDLKSTTIHQINLTAGVLTSNGDIIGNDGKSYGKFRFINNNSIDSQGRNFNIRLELTWNNNITNSNSFTFSMNAQNMLAHQNFTWSSNPTKINVTFGDLTKSFNSVGSGLTEMDETVFSVSSSGQLNRMEHVVNMHRQKAKALGNYSVPTLDINNARVSTFIDGGDWLPNIGNILGNQFFYPVDPNGVSTMLSSADFLQLDVRRYLRGIPQIEGETWADFEKRVFSEKYSWGWYGSSQGIGFAYNAGDFNENGWWNGKYSIDRLITDSYSSTTKWTTLSQVITGNYPYNMTQPQKNMLYQLYGNNGRYKGSIHHLRPWQVIFFPNYPTNITKTSRTKYIYNDKITGKDIEQIANRETIVPSLAYSIDTSEGVANVEIRDKDTDMLISGVSVTFQRKENNNWVNVSTTTSNASGLVTINNLYPGTYKFKINNYPTGYQSINNWSNNTSSDGEFTLSNRQGILVRNSLEKIKHQAVRFTVKDTAKKPIAGEVFSIMRNGQSVGVYPTDNHGVFSLARLNAGEYSLTPTNPLRTGARAFLVEEGKTNTLEVEAVLPVIPEITANGPNSINLGNVNIGQVTRSTIPLDVTYRGDNGYTVTARQSSNTNIDFELNDTLVTTQEKEFTNLNGTANPVTTVINYQLNAKTNSNSTKGNKSTNIIFSFKYKL